MSKDPQFKNIHKINGAIFLTALTGFGYYYSQQISNDQQDDESQPTTQKTIGLNNLGNTCYMNSLVQALSGSPNFINYIECIFREGLIRQNNPEDNIDIIHEFILLVLQVRHTDEDVNPARLYDLLCQEQEFTYLNEQCDTHELNVNMQDRLISCVPKNYRKNRRLQNSMVLDQEEDEQPMAKSFISADSSKSETELPVQNPFMAMHETTFECQKCSKYSEKYMIRRLEPYTDINLDLPNTNKSVKLRQLLEYNFNEEIIQDYMCMYCSLRQYLFKFIKETDRGLKEQILQQEMYPEWLISPVFNPVEKQDFKNALQFFLSMYQTRGIDEETFRKKFLNYKNLTNNQSSHELDKIKVSITKKKRIIRPPKSLCLHLNRLAYDNIGNIILNKSYVQFPEKNLDLAQFCPFAIDLKYNLSGVIEHIGNQQEGHYIAHKRISQDDWVVCNDHIVHSIKVQSVLKSKAYMLFYELVQEIF